MSASGLQLLGSSNHAAMSNLSGRAGGACWRGHPSEKCKRGRNDIHQLFLPMLKRYFTPPTWHTVADQHDVENNIKMGTI
eukprot:1154132-Pelagomonas_calceolata.AAC.3